MKKSLCPLALLVLITLMHFQALKAQVRSSVGIGVGINHPLQSGYRFGKDWALQGNIRLSRSTALIISSGAESVEGGKDGIYNGYYFVDQGRSVDLAFLRVAAKYYFNRKFFGYAGPAVYVGGEDAGSSGIGATLGAGYDLPIDDYSSLELMLHAGVRPVYDKTVPVAGLGMAYKFNFRKRL